MRRSEGAELIIHANEAERLDEMENDADQELNGLVDVSTMVTSDHEYDSINGTVNTRASAIMMTITHPRITHAHACTIMKVIVQRQGDGMMITIVIQNQNAVRIIIQNPEERMIIITQDQDVGMMMIVTQPGDVMIEIVIRNRGIMMMMKIVTLAQDGVMMMVKIVTLAQDGVMMNMRIITLIEKA